MAEGVLPAGNELMIYRSDRICLYLTQDIADTEISNLDSNGTINSWLRFSFTENVCRLEVIVEDGRMLTVEE